MFRPKITLMYLLREAECEEKISSGRWTEITTISHDQWLKISCFLPAAAIGPPAPARRRWPRSGPPAPAWWAWRPPAPVGSPAGRRGWCSRCRRLQGETESAVHTQTFCLCPCDINFFFSNCKPFNNLLLIHLLCLLSYLHCMWQCYTGMYDKYK